MVTKIGQVQRVTILMEWNILENGILREGCGALHTVH